MIRSNLVLQKDLSFDFGWLSWILEREGKCGRSSGVAENIEREGSSIRADMCDKFENYILGETKVESVISGDRGNDMEGVYTIHDGAECDSGAQQWG